MINTVVNRNTGTLSYLYLIFKSLGEIFRARPVLTFSE